MAVGCDEAGPSSRRQPPWGLLGMLALVAMIEMRLIGHDQDFTAVWHWDWRIVGKAATRPWKVANRDVLLFGDSLVKFGVMPRVIKERAGKTAYNFALHTGQTPSSYFMLRRTLRAGAKPSAIVLDLTPHMLSHAPEVNKHLWGELLTPWECFDFATTKRDPDFFATTLISAYLPTYRERHDLRASLMAALAGGTASRREQVAMFVRNWKVNDGAQCMSDSPAPTLNFDDWTRTLYATWAPNPVNAAYLDRFLSLADSRAIPVYWLLPPIHPEVQARTDASGFDGHYSRFVREAQARFPRTIVVDARHSGFAPDLFMDGAHVNRRGALKLSAAVAEVLRDPATLGSWVALDLGRAGAADSPIEDVWQSSLALKAAEAAMRR